MPNSGRMEKGVVLISYGRILHDSKNDPILYNYTQRGGKKIINRLGIKITSQNKYCLLFSEASKHSKQMSLDRGMCAREDGGFL